jgi:hypothetical protein
MKNTDITFSGARVNLSQKNNVQINYIHFITPIYKGARDGAVC